MDEYVVVISGIEHTVQLPDDQAKAAGLERKKKVAPPVADKARPVANKARTRGRS